MAIAEKYLYEFVWIAAVIIAGGFLALHYLVGMSVLDSLLSLVAIVAYVFGPVLAYALVKDGQIFLKLPMFLFLVVALLGCICVLYIYTCFLTLKLIAGASMVFFCCSFVGKI